jgi:hypothetical protein
VKLAFATALGLFAVPRAAPGQATSDSAPPSKALVTGVTQAMVYVAAGRADGLREGAVVHVRRLAQQGRYLVTHLSSRSAACRLDSLAVLPAVGDTVEFVPVVTGPSADRTEASGSATSAAPKRRGPSLRGRVGVRYLAWWDRDAGVSLSQPGVELLLDGPIAPGAPIGLSVDVRSRRTSTFRPGQASTAENLTGVYRAALRIEPQGSPIRAVIGRQYAPTLAGVGLFDGLLLDLQKPRWGAGVTAGLAPELGTLALSSEIRQLGGYLQARSRPGAAIRWSATAGAMGSYARDTVNREFAFFQGAVFSRAVSVILLQEIDVNRGWKAAAGESRLAVTSTYLSLRVTPASALSISGGLDNRRNVRLYRDLATPEDEFDDRFRMGAWGGVSLALGRHVRVGGDARITEVRGADSLRTSAVSGSVSVDRLTALGLGLRARAARYQTPGRGPGWFYAGAIRVAPGSIGSLELGGGGRQEKLLASQDRFWVEANAELVFARAWLILMTASREWGRDLMTPATDHLYTGLSYRF